MGVAEMVQHYIEQLPPVLQAEAQTTITQSGISPAKNLVAAPDQ